MKVIYKHRLIICLEKRPLTALSNQHKMHRLLQQKRRMQLIRLNKKQVSRVLLQTRQKRMLLSRLLTKHRVLPMLLRKQPRMHVVLLVAETIRLLATKPSKHVMLLIKQRALRRMQEVKAVKVVSKVNKDSNRVKATRVRTRASIATAASLRTAQRKVLRTTSLATWATRL